MNSGCEVVTSGYGTADETFCGAPAEFRVSDLARIMPLPSMEVCAQHAANYVNQVVEGRRVSFGWRVEPLDELAGPS